MTQSAAPDERATSPARRRLLHRALGLSGVAVVAAVTGCTVSDPRVHAAGAPTTATPGSTASSPSSPVPPAAEALQAEGQLAAVAAAILAGPHRSALDARQRPLLAALVEAHRQHAVALASPQPTSRPVTPGPSAQPTGSPPAGLSRLSLAQSIAKLATMEKAQAATLRRAALADRGFQSLLSASMGISATTYASALTSPTATPVAMDQRPRPPMAGVSDVEALQTMVRQLHAIVWGYQLALGRLSPGSASGRRALSSLKQHRKLRDRIITMLVSRSATVPAAAAAYVPSTDPTTSARAAKLIRQMETALQPFCGLWLASAVSADDRVLPLDTLSQTVSTARRWDAPLTAWPGWQD